MSEKRRALVTGAPGWLGTLLVERLRDAGHPVTCLVQPGRDTSQLHALGAETLTADLTSQHALDAADVKAALADADVVAHAAGVIHPRRVSDFYALNTHATERLLAAARTGKVRRFLYVSSNSAGGFNHRRSEAMQAAQSAPESPYGRSKALAEAAVRHAHSDALETTILRPCLYYGPGQPERIARLMRMIDTGRPPIFGDGRNLRSMCHLRHIVQAIVRAIDAPAAAGKTYWVADPRPYSTLEVMESIAQALGKPLRALFLPEFLARSAEVVDVTLSNLGVYAQDIHIVGESWRDIHCDVQPIIRDLGFEPEIELFEGMAEAVAWARAHGQL